MNKHNPTAAVITLAFMAFGLVTAEFLPISLLTDLSLELGISDAISGQLITVTAISAAISGPAVVLSSGRADRKTVLLLLAACLFAASLLGGLSGHIVPLLISRVVMGFALGGFWALSAAVVMQLVPPREVPKALALVAAGVSVATVTAAPFGAWSSQLFGWRIPVVAVAAMALLVIVALGSTLPPLPSAKKANVRSFLKVLGRRTVRTGLLVVFVMVSGHFAAFTFIRPLFETAALNAGQVSGLLLLFGVSGLAGNFAGGWLSSRSAEGAILSSAALLTASALALYIFRAGTAGIVAVAAWGLAFGAAPVSMQSYLLIRAPRHAEQLGALNLVTFQAGISAGALAGSLAVSVSGPFSVLLLPAALSPAAALILALGRRRDKKTRR